MLAPDLCSEEEITWMVHIFYGRVGEDPAADGAAVGIPRHLDQAACKMIGRKTAGGMTPRFNAFPVSTYG